MANIRVYHLKKVMYSNPLVGMLQLSMYVVVYLMKIIVGMLGQAQTIYKKT